jgi:hypothetical protein
VRRAVLLLLLSCVFGAATVVVAGPASACTCTKSTLKDSFNRADAVFLGSLESPDEAGADDDSGRTLHVFRVQTVYKGTAHREQGVVTPAAEADCGLQFGADGPFVVFASSSAHLGGGGEFTELTDGQYAVSSCGGTAPASVELEEALAGLASLPADPGLAEPPLAGAAGLELASANRVLPGALGIGAVLVLLVGTLLVRRRLLSRR